MEEIWGGDKYVHGLDDGDGDGFMGVSQGSPTPRPRTATGLQPVRNQVAQQEVSGEQSKLHLPLPISLPPEPSPPPPHPRKNCLPRNPPLVPKRLGTAGVSYAKIHQVVYIKYVQLFISQ